MKVGDRHYRSIWLAPDGRTAHFTDTRTGLVMRVGLDGDGWPKGTPEVYLDLRAEGLNPDGAVVDASGLMWLAHRVDYRYYSRLALYALLISVPLLLFTSFHVLPASSLR